MCNDTRLSAEREPRADAFLRSFLLAAILLAALRTPRDLFGLRAMLPRDLAGPGDVLASCLAGLSSGVLTCDARGRFALASTTPIASPSWSRWYLRVAASLRAARVSTSSSIANAEGRAAS